MGNDNRDIPRPEGEFRFRKATLCEDGSVEVFEKTSGPYTRQVYGAETHSRMVVLSPASAGQVALMLLCPEDLAVEAINDFLSDGDNYLMDLMDRMDALGIPYGYASNDGDHIAMRPAPKNKTQA